MVRERVLKRVFAQFAICDDTKVSNIGLACLNEIWMEVRNFRNFLLCNKVPLLYGGNYYLTSRIWKIPSQTVAFAYRKELFLCPFGQR